MRRSLAIVVVIAVVGFGAWLILHRGSGATTPAAIPEKAEHAAAGATAILDAPGKEAASRAAASSSSTAGEPVASTAEQGAAGETLLIVHVVSKADSAPLARVRVAASLASTREHTRTEVAATRGDLDHVPITDEHGRVEIEVPSDQPLELFADSGEERCGWTTTEVQALSAHERREIELQVPCGDDRHFFGRLLDRETNQPVVGASVRMMRVQGGRTNAAGEWIQEAKALRELRTDTAGRFDLAFPSWAEPYLRIEADGYGPLHAFLQPGHESADHTQDLLDSRAASLHASVLDAGGKPVTGSSIRLKADGYDLVTGGETQEPGTWANFIDETWSVELDARGTCVVGGLPAHVPLALEIDRAKRVLRREPDPIQLEPGQVLERTWTIGGGARIEGRTLDQHDAPVAKHEIWLMKKSGAGERYVEAHARSTTTAMSTSDEQGRFAFEDVPIGSWWIAAAPNEDQFAKPAETDVASKTQSIEITSAAAQVVTLRVTRGLFVHGRVVDPAGMPVPEVFVTCTQDGQWFPGQTRTDEAGTFVAGPLEPGTCVLWAGADGRFAASDRESAEPGRSDVVLHLRAAGRITGRVIDASTGKPCAATIHVVAEHNSDSAEGREIESETREEGRFLFDGLLPDRYELSFMTTDGRFGSLAGVLVTAGKDTADLEVKVVPGSVLSIRNATKVRGTSFRISNGSVPLTFERGIDVDTRESISVPTGRITVEYWTLDEKRARSPHKLDLDVAAGETREVVLRDDG